MCSRFPYLLPCLCISLFALGATIASLWFPVCHVIHLLLLTDPSSICFYPFLLISSRLLASSFCTRNILFIIWCMFLLMHVSITLPNWLLLPLSQLFGAAPFFKEVLMVIHSLYLWHTYQANLLYNNYSVFMIVMMMMILISNLTGCFAMNKIELFPC